VTGPAVPISADSVAEIEHRLYAGPGITALDCAHLIAGWRAAVAVADDLAIALHHCSAFLPLFLSEHGEEGRKLQRALAVHEQEQIAMKAYCDLTQTRRPDLTDRTVTPKDVHD
jgi:hypothetical protein